MLIKFFKYQGTGNDFVMIDNRENGIDLSQKQIEFLCHRRFGIGADGLIAIEKDNDFDFRMRYYNADGNEGSMCGNGGRCAVKFAHDLEIFTDKTYFIATDGPHHASISENGTVTLDMMNVNEITEIEENYFLNTGSPHLIIFVSDIKTIDVKSVGASIRYSDYWVARGGTNVNFVEILNDKISVRTYERGVEDETYSCGTGVTAATLVCNAFKNLPSPMNIETLGGNLSVSFKKNANSNYTKITLIGPAERVFEGNFMI